MKILLRFISLLLCFCLLAPCLISCKSEKRKERFTKTVLNYFDTVTVITGYDHSKEEFMKTADRIESRLGEYHKLYDAYNSKTDAGFEEKYKGVTNIKDINAVVGGEHRVCKVDKRIIDLLLFCKEVYALTDGETNVAMGSVLKLWHNERKKAEIDSSKAELPGSEALLGASLHTDIDKIIIDEAESTVFLSDPEMLLDVGAVAKGYATEMIARELEEMGKEGYALSVGGNVRTIGTKPGGEKWSIGIENPTDEFGGYIEILSIGTKSVVTSGSYQRYYTVGGKKYHHIIDKDTLYPSVFYESVSVVTDNSGLADALSTALFCMPLEDGSLLVESTEGVEAIWVLKDGSKRLSSGMSAYLNK